jgi:hypothetical protein
MPDSSDNLPTALSSVQMSKPHTEDSDDDIPATAEERELAQSLAAAKLQKERETELAKLQAKQKAAVEKEMARRKAFDEEQKGLQSSFGDLNGLDFGSSSAASPARPPPRASTPDNAVSDDGSYDSSDDDYQIRARSRRPSMAAGADEGRYDAPYGSLREGGAGLLDTPTGESDPFADDFFAGPATPAAKERKEW